MLVAIYENDYYGVYDPMRDLAEAICSDKNENLKRAEIMMKARGGYFGADAAKLYRNLGEEDEGSDPVLYISASGCQRQGRWDCF